MYFAFAPFPWDVNQIKHFMGLFDSIFHMFLFILIFKNFKVIWNDKTLKIILFILIFYLIAYGFVTGNFGTGLRHRTKFLIITIILVAPFIPNLIFAKFKHKKEKN